MADDTLTARVRAEKEKHDDTGKISATVPSPKPATGGHE